MASPPPLPPPPPVENVEAAALLAANLACDRLARRALVAEGAVEALVGLLRAAAVTTATTSATPLAACLAASALIALLAADQQQEDEEAEAQGIKSTSAKARRRFVDARGIEVACAALAKRGRSWCGDDGDSGALRLKVLLAALAEADGQVHAARLHAAASAAVAL